MDHLVLLDAGAGELEKILSGTKCMVVKEYETVPAAGQDVCPGDGLYFLRNNGETVVRVKAVVVKVLVHTNHEGDLSHLLKEMQTRLQLTEDQFNYWSANKHVMLVLFDSAQKIAPIQVVANQFTRNSAWYVFEDFNLFSEEPV